jgi:IMP cyclohydrolase
MDFNATVDLIIRDLNDAREIIDDLKKYIGYVNAQEIELNHLEKQKETFKNIYFTKDNKDILGKTSSSK